MPLNELISLLMVYKHARNTDVNIEFNGDASFTLRYGDGSGQMFDHLAEVVNHMAHWLNCRGIQWKV